jgi:uncharacterized delta-60 repeat protein
MKKLLLLLLILSTSTICKSQQYYADSTFNSTGILNYTVYNNIDRSFGCVAQADLKIVVVGLSKNSASNNFELCFVRFNQDGSVDNTFGTSGITKLSMGNQQSIGGMAPQIKIDGQGRFVAVNSGRSSSGNSQDMMVCRLDSAGMPDVTFNSTGVLFVDMTGAGTQPDLASEMHINSDGSLYVVGVTRTGATPLDNDFAVIKINATGHLDPSFNSNGKKLFNPTSQADFGHGIAVQADGKIVFGGTGGSKMYVMRIDSTGNYDTTFNHTGILKLNFASTSDMYTLKLDAQDRIVVGGTANSNSGAIARILSDGTLDSTFGTNGASVFTLGGAFPTIVGMHFVEDGKIIVGGSVTTASNGLDFYAARLDSLGSLDLSFNTTGYTTQAIGPAPTDDEAGGVCVLSDGRIFLSGTSVFSSAINEDMAFVLLKPDNFSVGINDHAISNALAAYPNPASEKIVVTSKEKTECTIYNSLGASVLHFSLNAGSNEIDLEGLQSGMYFLKNDSSRSVTKIIKE